jgi:hypothetical protein
LIDTLDKSNIRPLWPARLDAVARILRTYGEDDLAEGAVSATDEKWRRIEAEHDASGPELADRSASPAVRCPESGSAHDFRRGLRGAGERPTRVGSLIRLRDSWAGL